MRQLTASHICQISGLMYGVGRLVRGCYGDFEALSTRSIDCTSSQNMCLGSPGSLRSLSNSQMGPHTRPLTVSFSDNQRHTDNSDKSSRPDALYTSASRPSNTPATPYDHLAAPKPLEVALCPPWAHRAAPAAVLRRGGDGRWRWRWKRRWIRRRRRRWSGSGCG